LKESFWIEGWGHHLIDEDGHMPEGMWFFALIAAVTRHARSQTKNSRFSIFDKSKRLVGNKRLQNKLNHIFEERMEAVQHYLFKENKPTPIVFASGNLKS